MSFQQQWEDVEEDSNTTTIPDHEAMSDSKAEHPAEFAAHGLNIISHNIEKLALDITAAVDPGPPPDGGCTDGFGEDGFFAEYAIIDYRNAIILPESMNLKESSSLFCAGITAYNAINECELTLGEWIAVICCGGLGLYAIQYAKAMSFKVIGTDVNDATLSLATEAGADVVFNSMESKDKYVDDIQKATAGGAHAAAVFSAAKLAYDGALAVLRMGSLIMAIGLMAKPIEIDSIAFMRGLFRIKSISTGPPHKMPKAVEFTAKHGIKAKITEYPLEDINKMIESMRNGTSTGRMAVVF